MEIESMEEHVAIISCRFSPQFQAADESFSQASEG